MKIINIISFFIIIGVIVYLNNTVEFYGHESETHKHVIPTYSCKALKNCIKRKLTYCDADDITIPNGWECYTDNSSDVTDNQIADWIRKLTPVVYGYNYSKYGKNMALELNITDFRKLFNENVQFRTAAPNVFENISQSKFFNIVPGSLSEDNIKDLWAYFGLNISDKINMLVFAVIVAILNNTKSPYWTLTGGYLYNAHTGETRPVRSKNDLILEIEAINNEKSTPIDLDKVYERTDNKTYNIILDRYV